MRSEAAESKQSTLGTLYSIRAGLSYISSLGDQYDSEQEAINGHKAEIKKTEESAAHLKEEINNRSDRLKKMKSDKENYIQKTEQMKNDSSLEKERISKKKEWKRAKRTSRLTYFLRGINWDPSVGKIVLYIVSLLALIAFGIVFYIAIVPVFLSAEAIAEAGYGPGIAITIFTFGQLLAFHILMVVKLLKGFSTGNAPTKEECLTQLKKEWESLEKKCLAQKEWIENAPAVIAKKEKEIAEYEERLPQRNLATEKKIDDLQKKADAERQEIARCQSTRNNLKSKAKRISKKMIKLYGDRCHPDNWKNIDRILYYLITGRADTLQDALNLMDRRMDAEMVASEVKASGEMISGEIKKSRSAISSAVQAAVKSICNAINTSKAEIVQSLDQVSQNVERSNLLLEENNAIAAGQLDATQELVSLQEMTVALQKKSNATMSALLRDYERINGSAI